MPYDSCHFAVEMYSPRAASLKSKVLYGHNVSDGGAESVGSTVGCWVGAVVFGNNRLGGTDGCHVGPKLGGGVGVGPPPPGVGAPRIRLMTGFLRSCEQYCVVG